MCADRYDDGTSETTRDTPSSRRAFIGASVATGAGLLAGCISTGGGGGGGGSSGGNSSGGSTSLTIGYQPFYTEAWSALIIKHANLAEKYLPDGVSVGSWQVALQGSIVGNRMISGANQVGYTGDMPTITAIANPDTPISAVGMAGFSMGQQCNLGVIPGNSNIDAPQALNGQTFGVTTGACTHRFMLRMAEQEGLDYQLQDQDINSILAGIRQGNLAVGFGWEPTMTRVVAQENAGRFLLTGAPYNIPDAAGIIMPDSIINNSPEVARAWLKAELEAKHIMRTDQQRTVDLVSQEQELSDYSREVLRDVMYTGLDLNPDVNRLEFVTDYGSVEQAGTLLRENGPQYLMSQGFIDEIPGSDRYNLDPLNQAITELDGQVEWTPGGGLNGSSSANGTSMNSSTSSGR
jgi:ABC-type nitrate/sulfonate/bicarbonate transport system substrate-binding protein